MTTRRWLLISAAVLLAVAIPKERDVVWVPHTPTSELRMGSSAQTYRWATVTQEQAEAQYPEAWKAERRVEDVIRWNQWILLLPHVKGMMPLFVFDKNSTEVWRKGIGRIGIRVWVDKQEHVAFVQWFVPSHLGGVPVVVEPNPVIRRRPAYLDPGIGAAALATQFSSLTRPYVPLQTTPKALQSRE